MDLSQVNNSVLFVQGYEDDTASFHQAPAHLITPEMKSLAFALEWRPGVLTTAQWTLREAVRPARVMVCDPESEEYTEKVTDDPVYAGSYAVGSYAKTYWLPVDDSV